MLYLKHRLAVSSAAESLDRVREAAGLRAVLARPELGLISREKALMRAALSRFLKRDSNALDVGAHIGSVAAQIKRRCPEGRVLLFEPTRSKAAWLAKSFGADNVIEAAVSDRPGELPFIEDKTRPGYSRLARKGEKASYSVKVTRIDDVVPADMRLDLIKIDVEGHEHAALKGAEGRIAGSRPVIFFEAGALADPDQEDAARPLFLWLTQDLGYVVYPVFGVCFDCPPCSAEAFEGHRTYPFSAFNFVAVPEEKVSLFGVRPPRSAGRAATEAMRELAAGPEPLKQTTGAHAR